MSSLDENPTPSSFYTDLHTVKESRQRSTSVSLHLGSKELSAFVSPTKLGKSANFMESRLTHARSTPSISELDLNKLKVNFILFKLENSQFLSKTDFNQFCFFYFIYYSLNSFMIS